MMAVLVRQKHDYGCGVACLAMVMGTTYDVIHERLLNEWVGDKQTREWLTDRGLHDGIIQWFLARNQRVWQQVFVGWKWEPWPPEPFAPIHIAQVRQPSGNSHYVVMTATGAVLDPLSDEPSTLTAWEKVNNVTGIWRTPPIEPTTNDSRSQAGDRSEPNTSHDASTRAPQ